MREFRILPRRLGPHLNYARHLTPLFYSTATNDMGVIGVNGGSASAKSPTDASRTPPLDEDQEVPAMVPNGHAELKQDVEEEDAYIVTWDQSDAHENPRSWSRRYRMFLVFIVSCYTLLSPICSTMNAPALDTLQREFHVESETVTNMMMSASMLAFVIAPMFYGPLSERLGRKYILQVSNVMYVQALTQFPHFQRGMRSVTQRRADDYPALFQRPCGLCSCCDRRRGHCGSL